MSEFLQLCGLGIQCLEIGTLFTGNLQQISKLKKRLFSGKETQIDEVTCTSVSLWQIHHQNPHSVGFPLKHLWPISVGDSTMKETRLEVVAIMFRSLLDPFVWYLACLTDCLTQGSYRSSVPVGCFNISNRHKCKLMQIWAHLKFLYGPYAFQLSGQLIHDDF